MDSRERSQVRLVGTLVGLAAGLVLAVVLARDLAALLWVMVVALPFGLPLTLFNAFLFSHFGSDSGRSGAIAGGLVGGVIGTIESLVIWRVSPTPLVQFVVGLGAVAYLLVVVRTFARPLWDRVLAPIDRFLSLEVGVALPRQEEPRELYYRPYPRKLQWNIPALILGPFWYLLVGLWVHFSILVTIVATSGGLLAPLVWLYCGLKANEDLLEFRIARHNVY